MGVFIFTNAMSLTLLSLQDKSYFLGALRTKMTELTSEVARLGREAEAATKEQSTYLAYDKRVKELAEDVTSYQVRQTNTDTEDERLHYHDPGSTG